MKPSSPTTLHSQLFLEQTVDVNTAVASRRRKAQPSGSLLLINYYDDETAIDIHFIYFENPQLFL